MEKIMNYHKAQIEIESQFQGLPHVHLLVIKMLTIRADLSTGIVDNISYRDISALLTVDPGSGRKDTGTPQKETIRSYLRSIEKQCPEHFKIISEGQKLQFQFPNLPAIYAKFFDNKEEYTDCDNAPYPVHPIENIDEIIELNSFENTQEYTQPYIDEYTPESAVKKLFINNKINNNNNNRDEKFWNKNTPKTILPNFYPSQEIISRAIAAGYTFATDPDIIQEFIDKNTAWGSTFADFNPIYLSFLARHAERKQQALIPITTQTRSRHYERTPNKINSYERALEEVRRNNQNACKPSADNAFPPSKIIFDELEHRAHIMALGGIDQDVRSAVSY